MYTSNCYLLHCKTNLHAGSGDTNYGIIDKMVQRDPVTNLPSIYASSLKGAFREYFEEGPEKNKLKDIANQVFGSKTKTEKENSTNGKTDIIFHEAQLIGLPVRSNKKPYFIATSKTALLNLVEKLALIGIPCDSLKAEVKALPDVAENTALITGEDATDLLIEDFEDIECLTTATNSIQQLVGKNIALFHENDFTDLCSDYNLPVIARNNLENGESKNLWYEQIVPHQSRFVFFTVSVSGSDLFEKAISGKAVQIGANSSLGYGHCSISKLSLQ